MTGITALQFKANVLSAFFLSQSYISCKQEKKKKNLLPYRSVRKSGSADQGLEQEACIEYTQIVTILMQKPAKLMLVDRIDRIMNIQHYSALQQKSFPS
jgi:hypothetical protein